MKHVFLVFIISLATLFLHGQQADYKVVFDMTSKDPVNQQAVVRQVTGISDSSPGASLEVVVYGQGIDLVLKGKSEQESAVTQLLADKKATFKVCAATMKRNNVDKSSLLPGVEVVPDGIYQIILRQREGWGYIKVAH